MYEHFHDIFRTFSDFLPFSDLVSFRVQSARSLRSGLKERPTEGGTCRRITGRVEEIYKFVHFCTKCFRCFRCVQSVLPGTPVKASCGRAKSLQTRHGLRMQIVAHKAFSIEISHLPEIWGCRKQWRAISFLQLSCRAYAKQRKQRQWFWNQARWDFVHQSAKIWKNRKKHAFFFWHWRISKLAGRIPSLRASATFTFTQRFTGIHTATDATRLGFPGFPFKKKQHKACSMLCLFVSRFKKQISRPDVTASPGLKFATCTFIVVSACPSWA